MTPHTLRSLCRDGGFSSYTCGSYGTTVPVLI